MADHIQMGTNTQVATGASKKDRDKLSNSSKIQSSIKDRNTKILQKLHEMKDKYYKKDLIVKSLIR